MFIEVRDAAGAVRRVEAPAGRTSVRAQQGARYRLTPDTGHQIESGAMVKRVGDDLIVEGLGGERVVEIEGFFVRCTPSAPCEFSLTELGGLPGSTLGPDARTIGALPDGSLLLHANDRVSTAAPLPAGEVTGDFKGVIAGAAMIGVVGAAAGGGKGGAASDAAPTVTDTASGATATATPPSPGTGAGATPPDAGAPPATARVLQVSIASVTDDRAPVTGTVSEGGVSNDPTPRLTGTLSAALLAGETVRILRGGVVAGAATVDGLQWSYQEGVLPHGSVQYQARVEGTAGLVLATSASRTWMVDLIPPSAPTVTTIAGDGVISYPESGTVLTVGGSAEPGAGVAVSFGSTTLSTQAATNGAFSVGFAPAALPGNGSYSISAVATDAAGNASATAGAPVSVNTTATVYGGTSSANTYSLTALLAQNLRAPGADLDAGGGVDILQMSGAGIALDLTLIAAGAVVSFERLDLTGTGANSLTLALSDVLDLGRSNVFNHGNGWSGLGGNVQQQQVVIDGNADDRVVAVGGWTLDDRVTNSGRTYDVYVTGNGSSNGMLIIDTSIGFQVA